jgi:hypothetical protein
MAGLLAVSIVVAVIGLVQAGLIARGPSAGPPEPHAALDGMQIAVAKSQFLSHEDMDPIPLDPAAPSGPVGYQMPGSMMPGMPAEGRTRLMIQLQLVNGVDKDRTVDPANEFLLRDERGQTVLTEGDTFGGLSRLTPSTGMAGALFFDVPTDGAASHQWVLEWKRGRHTARLAVTPGAVPAHSH